MYVLSNHEFFAQDTKGDPEGNCPNILDTVIKLICMKESPINMGLSRKV